MPGTYLNHYQDHLERQAEYTDLVTRLQTVDAALAQIQADIGNISGGGSGGIGGLSFDRNFDLLNPDDDLIYLLGTNDNRVAYANPHPSKIAVSASSIQIGSVTLLTDRLDGDFLTTNTANSWVQIDLARDIGRLVQINGVGLKSRIDNAAHPNNLIIEGSNDGISFFNIFDWDNIGYTAPYQWKYTTFAKSSAYRYIRIRQPNLNTSGQNFLGISEINLYGTLIGTT